MKRCIVKKKKKTKHLESVANKVRNKGNLYLILAYLHDILDYAEYTTKNRLITKIKKEKCNYKSKRGQKKCKFIWLLYDFF